MYQRISYKAFFMFESLFVLKYALVPVSRILEKRQGEGEDLLN